MLSLRTAKVRTFNHFRDSTNMLQNISRHVIKHKKPAPLRREASRKIVFWFLLKMWYICRNYEERPHYSATSFALFRYQSEGVTISVDATIDAWRSV